MADVDPLVIQEIGWLNLGIDADIPIPITPVSDDWDRPSSSRSSPINIPSSVRFNSFIHSVWPKLYADRIATRHVIKSDSCTCIPIKASTVTPSHSSDPNFPCFAISSKRHIYTAPAPLFSPPSQTRISF
ncbi:hypothetical protein EYR40_004401 [Pleurotus pulmonarius]|nr:hypothetical protein EYR40_004401 [Pleurotus pulmonarius]